MSTVIKDETALKRFAVNLERLMLSRGITQADLSRLTGENESRLSHYRHEKRLPSLAIAARIAEALDCTVDELLKK